MNLFFHLKSRYYLIINTLLLCITSLILSYKSQQLLYLLFALTGIVLFIFARIGSRNTDKTFHKIYTLADEITNGRLEYRITSIDPYSRYSDVAWKLNEALDQFETFMREVDAVFVSTNAEEFYRYTLSKGLKGRFSTTMENIQSTIASREDSYWMHKKNELYSALGQLKTENLLRSLSQNQRDLNTISGEMLNIENISRQTADNATRSLDEVKQLIMDLNAVIDKSIKLRESSKQLSVSTEQIAEMITTISSVADQTNLLALNAAIEAARAGEHGRGFAVVADEVKNLSYTTKEAATQVSDIMSKFLHATENMVSDTISMADLSERSKSVIGDFEQNFETAATDAQQVYSKVSYVQIICQTALTKVDHLIYMQRAYEFAEDYEHRDMDRQAIMKSSQDCNFGQWYNQGIGQQHYSHLACYHDIAQPHQGVHDNVHKAVQILDQDWQRNPQLHRTLLEAFQQAEKYSTELTEWIETMAQEKMQSDGIQPAA